MVSEESQKSIHVTKQPYVAGHKITEDLGPVYQTMIWDGDTMNVNLADTFQRLNKKAQDLGGDWVVCLEKIKTPMKIRAGKERTVPEEYRNDKNIIYFLGQAVKVEPEGP